MATFGGGPVRDDRQADMTTVRVSERFRCKTAGCPWSKDEEIHVPWCLHIEGVEHRRDQPWHQHWPKRSQGGKRIVAILCSYCSDRVDNTPDWDNAVQPGEDGQEEFVLWDTRVEGGWNHPLIRRVLEAGMRTTPRYKAAKTEPGPDTKVPGGDAHPSASGKSGAAIDITPERQERMLGGKTDSMAAPPSLETWCREGMELVYWAHRVQLMTTGLAFEIGDWANAGENTLGEAAHQFFGVFSYWQIATWASVARRVPALGRHKELPFGHHQAVAMLPGPEQREKLDEAAAAKWPLKTLREAVGAPSAPKVRRWSLEELDFLCPTCRAVLEAL